MISTRIISETLERKCSKSVSKADKIRARRKIKYVSSSYGFP